MKNFLRLFIVVCILLVFNTYAFGTINEDRFPKNREGFSSIVGVYHAELTFDFSRGWNNPAHSYRVLKNELGLDVSCIVSKERANSEEYSRNNTKGFYYNSDVNFKINNRDFSSVGKKWYLYATPEFPDYREVRDRSGHYIGTSIGGPEYRSGFFHYRKEINGRYNAGFVTDANIDVYRTDLRSTVTLIILDYLWENPEDKHIDNRDNDNRNDNPNDEGRDHRRRREPLRRMR